MVAVVVAAALFTMGSLVQSRVASAGPTTTAQGARAGRAKVAKQITAPVGEVPNRAIPSADDVAKLYAVTGRELTAASRVDATATVDLWPRYRWIRLLDAIKTAPKRAEAYTLLQRVRADLHAPATTRGRGSAAD